jgi:hypothetical protein
MHDIKIRNISQGEDAGNSVRVAAEGFFLFYKQNLTDQPGGLAIL